MEEERKSGGGGRYEQPRFRDGLYLRLGAGLGIARDSAEAKDERFETEPGSSGRYDGTAGGLAAVSEVALGYSLKPGIVLGAGIYTATIPSSSAEAAVNDLPPYDFSLSQLELFAVLVDVYPDPNGGLHVQGALGVSAFIAGQADTNEPERSTRAHTAVGWGAMLGVGYEWWVADQWALGVLGRVQYGTGSGTDPESVDWDHGVWAPAALITATHH